MILKNQIKAAAKHVPLKRLALTTQYGFASPIERNSLPEDDEYAKLELIGDVGTDIWGSVVYGQSWRLDSLLFSNRTRVNLKLVNAGVQCQLGS